MSKRVGLATSQVHSVSALLFGFLTVHTCGFARFWVSGTIRSAIARACSHRRIPTPKVCDPAIGVQVLLAQ